MKAMIFAAGLGTRLKPLTDTIPKALVPIGGVPLLEHLILKMKAAGFSEIVINVHHFAEQIIDFLQQKQNFGVQIHISDEREKLLDTGGGIKKSMNFFMSQEPILVHNVDILSNVDLAHFYTMHDNRALATLLVNKRKTSRYLCFDNDNRLVGWVNTTNGAVKSPYKNFTAEQSVQLAFSGIHVISPRIFDRMTEWIGAFSIIDFYLAVAEQEPIVGFNDNALQLLDVGKIDVLHDAEDFLQKI